MNDKLRRRLEKDRAGAPAVYESGNNYERRVVVPAHYRSDEPPALDLRDLRASVSQRAASDHQAPTNAKGQRVPYRLVIELDANAEAIARLAAFFGLYDRESWDRRAGEQGLPPAPTPPALPMSTADVAKLRGAEPSDLDPCPCGHRREHHEYELEEPRDGAATTATRMGVCARPGCGCLGFGFAGE